MDPGPVVGLVLAAGSGRRYGAPKALVRTAAGTTWVEGTVGVLEDAGCDRVLVVVGAAAAEVVAVLGGRADAVQADGWEDGMHASLAAGLAAAEQAGAEAVVVMLVDLPDVTAPVVRRVLDAVTLSPAVLARAAYDGVPGHPVVVGRDHFDGVRASATGDAGARDYLRARTVQLVECGDLATGRDVDRP